MTDLNQSGNTKSAQGAPSPKRRKLRRKLHSSALINPLSPMKLKTLTHSALIDLARSFSGNRISNRGVCYGTSLMLGQAIATGEEAVTHFYNRFDYISDYLKECKISLMSENIEKDIEERVIVLKEGVLFLNQNGMYVTVHKKKVYLDSLLKGEYVNPNLKLDNLCNKVLNADFQQSVLEITSKRGHTYSNDRTPETLKTEIDDIFKKRVQFKENVENKNLEPVNTDFSEDELTKIDVRAFFEAVAMHQKFDIISDSFHRHHHSKKVFPLTLSKKFEETPQNTLDCRSIGIINVTTGELAAYLTAVKDTLMSEESKAYFPISFILSSGKHQFGYHSTNLCFNSKSQTFNYMDVNALSKNNTYFTETAPDILAPFIFSTFSHENEPHLTIEIMAIFNTQISPALIDKLKAVTLNFLFLHNKTEKNCISPLWAACWKGQLDIVHYLLKENPNLDVNESTVYAPSPLMYSLMSREKDIAQLLLEKDAHWADLFFTAVKKNNFDLAYFLSKHGQTKAFFQKPIQYILTTGYTTYTAIKNPIDAIASSPAVTRPLLLLKQAKQTASDLFFSHSPDRKNPKGGSFSF